MKKWILLILAIILFGIFSLIRSCQRSSREVINVYTDKEIEYFIGKFAKKFERNENKVQVKINDLNNMSDYDIIITDEKENVKNLKKDFKSKDLFKDELVVIGRRRIENISQVVNSTIAIPNYKTNIGKTGLDILAKLDNFSEISKKIEYKDDAISSLQSVDLYEVDYAFIPRNSLAFAKNSEICYRFPPTMEANKILYRIYLDTNSSDNSKNFYNFLEEEFAEKVQEKPKSEKIKQLSQKMWRENLEKNINIS